MENVPSLIGALVLFGVVYFLTEATLSTFQLVSWLGIALLVYGATIFWHIRNNW